MKYRLPIHGSQVPSLQRFYFLSLQLNFFVVRLGFFVPLDNFSLIWRRQHCRWRAAIFDLLFGTHGHWAVRVRQRASPTVTSKWVNNSRVGQKNHNGHLPLGNPRQIPLTTSDLGRIIVIDMRLRLTFVMRSVVGLPHRETPTRFL